MSDAEFLHTQWRDTINQFKEDYDKWEKHTLKDYLIRCAEIVNNQINNNVIDIKVAGISSYLYAQLNKEGITVSDRHIQNILPDDDSPQSGRSNLVWSYGLSLAYNTPAGPIVITYGNGVNSTYQLSGDRHYFFYTGGFNF